MRTCANLTHGATNVERVVTRGETVGDGEPTGAHAPNIAVISLEGKRSLGGIKDLIALTDIRLVSARLTGRVRNSSVVFLISTRVRLPR